MGRDMRTRRTLSLSLSLSRARAHARVRALNRSVHVNASHTWRLGLPNRKLQPVWAGCNPDVREEDFNFRSFEPDFHDF